MARYNKICTSSVLSVVCIIGIDSHIWDGGGLLVDILDMAVAQIIAIQLCSCVYVCVYETRRGMECH